MNPSNVHESDELDTQLREAVARGRVAARDGVLASYIPELQRADPASVGIAIATLDGRAFTAGDAFTPFTIQSVSKVCSLACVLRSGGAGLYPDRVSVEPSSDEFHSITRLEEERGRPRNPMINAGVIAVSGCVAGSYPTERVDALRRFLGAAHGPEAPAFPLDGAGCRSECRGGAAIDRSPVSCNITE
jgi:glutaminase